MEFDFINVNDNVLHAIKVLFGIRLRRNTRAAAKCTKNECMHKMHTQKSIQNLQSDRMER